MIVAKFDAVVITFAENLMMLQQSLFSEIRAVLLNEEHSRQMKLYKKSFVELKYLVSEMH